MEIKLKEIKIKDLVNGYIDKSMNEYHHSHGSQNKD